MRLPVVAAVALFAIAPAPVEGEPGRGWVVRVEHRPFEEAPALGPRDAPVTVELFFTPGSATSQNAYRTLVELQRRHPTRIRAVFRPTIRSAQVAVPAIVMAAAARGKFFALMDSLASRGLAPGAAVTGEVAVKLGVDRATVERAAVDDAIIHELQDNAHRHFRTGESSIPVFMFNGHRTSPRLTQATATATDLEGEYQLALDAARYALGQGVPIHALVDWGERLTCADDDRDDDAPHPAAPPTEAPAYGWHLGGVVDGGTGCAARSRTPPSLDDAASGNPPDEFLLAEPLPTDDVPSFGPGDAAVPIFVVCDLRGRACRDQFDRAHRVAEYYPGDVRVLYLPWVDLTEDSTQRDLDLAEAVICAAIAGDGWLFASKAMTQPSFSVDAAAVATGSGLDPDRVLGCAQDGDPHAHALIAAAQRAGIGSSPTVVVGGRAYVGGFTDDHGLGARIDAELGPGLFEALVPSW